MHLTCTLAFAGLAHAAVQGFNYGPSFDNGAPKEQSDFEAEFSRAKTLQGTSGWTSARLYTMIQAGTADTPSSAIPAAINTNTSILLGLWASAGQADFTNEITALQSAINQYGTAFVDLIIGISVGSEDLYRITPTGIENNSGAGADPDTLVNYITQTKAAISGTAASRVSVGHVDTWTAWVNGSNTAVINAVDWLGFDAYVYFEVTLPNSIDVAYTTFYDAWNATLAVSQGKQVWCTETGWPVSGPTSRDAVPSVANAKTYWDEVGCSLFERTNTWWFTLQDAEPNTPSPSFGIIGSDLNSPPLYDLSCPAISGLGSSSSSSPASSATPVSTSAASPTMPSSAAGSNTESVNSTPGPETSPASMTTSPPLSSPGASQTATTELTTLVTVTNCPGGCSSTMTTEMSSTPASSASSATSPPSSSPTTVGKACPTNLSGEYQFPHLIVPVDSTNPTKAYGTSYNGTITSTISSIFNFDIPASYAGQTCSLVFLFPEQAALTTSAYTFNSQGGITVSMLSAPATAATTYDTVPMASMPDVGTIPNLESGNGYVVATKACPAGDRIAFEFESTGGLDLSFFQDYNPSPLGAFITVC